MEEEIKEILNNKLIGNDTAISDIIISYLKKRCFICWKYYLEGILEKSYCDVKTYPQLYMDICPICIDKFKFRRCYKCHIYVDSQKAYTLSKTLDNICCQYCLHSESITEYSGWL